MSAPATPLRWILPSSLTLLTAAVVSVLVLQNWSSEIEKSADGGKFGDHEDDDDGSGGDDDDDSSFQWDDSSTAAATVAPFPWEPWSVQGDAGQAVDNQNNKGGNRKYKFRDRKSVPSSGTTAASAATGGGGRKQTSPPDKPLHQNDELDFLANMTFANGGLRAPSCPCCH